MKSSLIGLVIVTVLALPGTGLAQSRMDQPSAWQYEFTPYLWMAGLKGSVGVGNLATTGVEVGFDDIMDMFEAGFMGTFEARKGKLGVWVDASYLKVSDSAVRQATVGPGLGLAPGPVTLTTNVNFELENRLFQFAGMYRLADGPTAWDVVGGARYNEIKPEITLVGTLTGAHVRSRKEHWWDGFVGLRFNHPIASRWSLVGYADIGAGSSDSTWQALASLNYEVSKTMLIKLAYRHYAVDYNKSDFRYDMETSGPLIGAGIRF